MGGVTGACGVNAGRVHVLSFVCALHASAVTDAEVRGRDQPSSGVRRWCNRNMKFDPKTRERNTPRALILRSPL